VVRLFLDKGFDVNVMYCDEDGKMSSLLVKAATFGGGADEELKLMVQLLLDRGALADAIDHTRITALTHATRQTLGVISNCLIEM
jgi:hypothetical protein